MRRQTFGDVLHANFQRLFEALRSLEEFSKLPSPALSMKFERMRYRAYELHRAVGVAGATDERLEAARLYVLLDGGASEAQFEKRLDALIAAGVPMIQLRDKKLSDRELLARAKALHHKTRGAQTLFIMNDRPDIAALARADGVHVGQEELSVKDVRAILGPKALVGVSTHSLEQARQAVLDGASYIGVGPVFESQTKPFKKIPGVRLLRSVMAEIKLPAFAIGGVTLDNVGEVLAAGAARVAVSGAIANARNPEKTAQKFLERLAKR